jgi:hypothetical protein
MDRHDQGSSPIAPVMTVFRTADGRGHDRCEREKETAMRLFALAVLAITAFAAPPTFRPY